MKIILISSDDKVFEVDEAVASESQTIKNFIGEDCPKPEFKLSRIESSTLEKVLEYCAKHAEQSSSSSSSNNNNATESNANNLKLWDADFIKVSQDTLYNLILAADFLNIKGLLDLTCQAAAGKMKGKTAAQIRRMFNIRSDFTREEKAQMRRQNPFPAA